MCASYVYPEEFRKSLWAPGLIFSGKRLLPRQGVCAGERHDSVLAEPPGRPREFVCCKEGLAYRSSSWSTKGCLEGPCR